MKKGDLCYIIENNRKVTPAMVLSRRGNLYTIRLATGVTIRVPGHRLFESEEEAARKLPEQGKRYRTPYDYM